VNLRRGLLTVPAAYAKNGHSRTVPLNGTVRGLRQNPAGPRQRARGSGAGFRLACEATGLQDVTPHAPRHTFASRLAMAGVDPQTIKELGGWRSLAMVERYTPLSPTHKAAAVERIAVALPNAIPKAGPFARHASCKCATVNAASR